MAAACASVETAAIRYRYRSRSFVRDREEAGRFWLALRGALHSAQGLGAGFRLIWRTGPAGSVDLLPEGRAGPRWFAGAFAPCYDATQWYRTVDSGASPAVRAQRRGVVGPDQSLPLRPEDGSPAWVETVHAVLPELAAGGTVEWKAQPASPRPAQGLHPPELEQRFVPAGFRTQPLSRLELETRDRLDRRRRQASWGVSVVARVSGSAPSTLLGELCGLVQAASQTGSGAALRWVRPWPWMPVAPGAFLASEAEVAALLPDRWSDVAFGEADGARVPGLPIGRTVRGATACFPFPVAEGRHAALLGETGMGKSSALVSVALAASRRGAVLLFDPIGDSARAFLDRLPSPARGRAIWVSPADAPLPINALDVVRTESGGEFHREKARLDLVSALRRVRAFRYADTPFWGPRLEEMLGRAVACAAALPGGTLVEAQALLAGRLPREPPGLPLQAADAYRELREAAIARPDEVDGARRLLAEVTENAVLRKLLAVPESRLRPYDLVGPSAITVISGDAPVVGETTARYLLAVYLALLWSELLARPGGPKTVVALDEAQWYAHDAAAEILRLGRRSNVHLYLATQSLNSLLPPVREAVLTNAADFLVFRGAPEDAREFSRWRADVGPDLLLSLGRGEAVLLVGKGQRATRLQTSALPPSDESGRARQELRERLKCWEVAAPTAPPANPATLAPAEADELEELLRAAMPESGAQESFDFPFERVRLLYDPPGIRVRALGKRLRAAQALLGRGHGPDGAFWRLSTRAVARTLPPEPDPEIRARARERWKTVREPPATGGERF